MTIMLSWDQRCSQGCPSYLALYLIKLWPPRLPPFPANWAICTSTTGVTVWKHSIQVKNSNLCPVWPWNLMDDLKQGKSEGFESWDRPIVRKRPIWVKIGDVLSHVTLKFDGWPWKTIGHLSFAVSSFVQHFIAIGEFKLELQSGNAQFGSNSTTFRAVWPCNLTYELEKQ